MFDATLAKVLIERGTIAVYETAMGYWGHNIFSYTFPR